MPDGNGNDQLSEARLESLNALIARRDQQCEQLILALSDNKERLEDLAKRVNGHWGCSDGIYRFYHYSFKVYRLQSYTTEIVSLLREMVPDAKLNSLFTEILEAGTGKQWEESHNKEWSKHTRPIVEAFLHARFFLNIAVTFAGQFLEDGKPNPPQLLPSDWATLLYFYNLR